MEKHEIYAAIAGVCFIAILFSPSDSRVWGYFLILGLLFLLAWFMKRKK